MDDSPALERETYLAERRTLVDAEHDQARLYDRAILTLSGGALALSLTFIHDIADSFDRTTLLWLYLGWSGFITSLLATLTSFQVSQSAMRRQREIIDSLHSQDQRTADPATNPLARWTLILNWLSLTSFICGASFLAVFVGMNFGG